MKMQNQFHNTEDGEESGSFVSENCHYCKEELIKIKDIFVDKNDHYCCKDCDNYYKLNAVECKEI